MGKTEICIPLLLLLAIVSVCAYTTYFTPQGPWYVAVYPDRSTNAFAAATHFADAVVQSKPGSQSATVYISNPAHARALQQSGAILLDPKGIELCSQN